MGSSSEPRRVWYCVHENACEGQEGCNHPDFRARTWRIRKVSGSTRAYCDAFIEGPDTEWVRVVEQQPDDEKPTEFAKHGADDAEDTITRRLRMAREDERSAVVELLRKLPDGGYRAEPWTPNEMADFIESHPRFKAAE